MRLALLSLAAGAAFYSFGANAETVDCRTIADIGKRLMCYDQLNEQESSKTAHTVAPAPVARPVKSSSDLSGFYVGATFGFGSSTDIEHRVSTSGYPNYYGYTNFDSFRANAPTIGVTGGYNAFAGSSLFGIQLDITGDVIDKKRSYDHYAYSSDLPRYSGSGWSSWPHGKPVGSVDHYEYSGGVKASAASSFYRYREQIAPTISARFGHQFDNMLLYGRVGVGVARIKETFGYDDSKSVYCGSTTYENRYITDYETEQWAIACNNSYNGDITTSSRTITRPTATFAIGGEYHFDQYFVRLEGEMKHTFLDRKLNFSADTGLTQYKITTGIGIRF